MSACVRESVSEGGRERGREEGAGEGGRGGGGAYILHGVNCRLVRCLGVHLGDGVSR